MSHSPRVGAFVHLHLLPPRQEGDEMVYAAALRVEGDDTPPGEIPESDRLWFAVPSELAPHVTDTADPFVAGMVFRCMGRGLPVRVHGRVSPTLLAGLEEYMEIFHSWWPKLCPVAITADDEREPDPPTEPGRAMMTFTGGLDSCHTAWRHKKGRVGRRRVDLAVGIFAHGIDLRLEQTEIWNVTRENTRRLLASLGMDLWTLRTSFHRLDRRNYESHAAMVIACLLLFQRRFGTALIASGNDYARFFLPDPTTPLSDPLLSTGTCRVIHDGCERSRPDKAVEISDWPTAMTHLRVCARKNVDGRNCGRCEKCVRTILNFRVAGYRSRPRSRATSRTTRSLGSAPGPPGASKGS